jgi:hypothetical protein
MFNNVKTKNTSLNVLAFLIIYAILIGISQIVPLKYIVITGLAYCIAMSLDIKIVGKDNELLKRDNDAN